MTSFKPLDSFVCPLLTDMYEITMAYAMWQSGRTEKHAVFDLFFRKNPFGGEFTVFCGLEEVLRFVSDYHFTDEQVAFVKQALPANTDEGFFKWLKNVNCKEVKLYALKEGSVCFPRVPLIRVEGPMGICQLLETTLLCLINFPSLVATNAARIRLAAGKEKRLIEFGLRRAQGPDGAVSATRYTYIGGFDGTSNMLAAQLFKISSKGTHAHSWVESFTGEDTIEKKDLVGPDGKSHDFLKLVLECQKELGFTETSKTELLSFIAYARAFPKEFVALVDTYDTLKSGVPNFLSVALALDKVGYKAVGLRLDSGDMSHLSKETRKLFNETAEKCQRDYFKKLVIFCSNELSEDVILGLNRHGHEIDVFAVGTHLVTCQKQPALGCVYKLVEIDGTPCIKLSNEIGKVSIPGRKAAFRLFSSEGYPLADIMTLIGKDQSNEEQAKKQKIEVGTKVFCRDAFDPQKRVYITPSKVVPLHELVWDGKVCGKLPSIDEIKDFCQKQVENMREDHIRPLNPTPYKVSVTDELHKLLHEMWIAAVPIREMS